MFTRDRGWCCVSCQVIHTVTEMMMCEQKKFIVRQPHTLQVSQAAQGNMLLAVWHHSVFGASAVVALSIWGSISRATPPPPTFLSLGNWSFMLSVIPFSTLQALSANVRVEWLWDMHDAFDHGFWIGSSASRDSRDSEIVTDGFGLSFEDCLFHSFVLSIWGESELCIVSLEVDYWLNSKIVLQYLISWWRLRTPSFSLIDSSTPSCMLVVIRLSVSMDEYVFFPFCRVSSLIVHLFAVLLHCALVPKRINKFSKSTLKWHCAVVCLCEKLHWGPKKFFGVKFNRSVESDLAGGRHHESQISLSWSRLMISEHIILFVVCVHLCIFFNYIIFSHLKHMKDHQCASGSCKGQQLLHKDCIPPAVKIYTSQ